MSTQHFPVMTSPTRPSPRKQRGVVLFIALIVMVAMSLAAIAMFRSVDTANLVAGNQAFKQSALNSTDVGLAAAMDKFTTAGFLFVDANTHSNSAANCYVATTLQESYLDPRGFPKVLLDPATTQSPNTASFTTTYDATCKITNAANGDVVRYLIDRQCDASSSGAAATNEHCLVASSSTSSQTDNEKHTGSETIPLYRISVRVDGPRKTVSYVQAVIKP